MKRSFSEVCQPDTKPKPFRFGVPRDEPGTALLEKHEIMALLAMNSHPVDPVRPKEELLQSLNTMLVKRKTSAPSQMPPPPVVFCGGMDGPSVPNLDSRRAPKFLRKDEQQQRRLPPCSICRGDDAAHVFSVCGHLGVCTSCKEKLFQTQSRGTFGGPVSTWMNQFAKCPICRTEHSKLQVKPVYSS